MGREGPKWGGDAFFRHEKTLPTCWAEGILIFRIFIFLIFGAPNLGLAWQTPPAPALAPECPRINFRAPRGPDVDLCYVLFFK